MLLAAVAVVASVGYVRTANANAQEKIQRTKAEETSALAVEALDSIFRQFAPDRTAPVSASLRVSDADDPITVPVQPVLSKEAAVLLEHMLKFYDRLADQGGDDARLRRKVAEANRRVGDIRQRLGHYPESKAAYLRAIELYTRLAKSSATETDLQAEIARIHNELGNVYEAMNDAEAGRKSHLDALATLRGRRGILGLARLSVRACAYVLLSWQADRRTAGTQSTRPGWPARTTRRPARFCFRSPRSASRAVRPISTGAGSRG